MILYSLVMLISIRKAQDLNLHRRDRSLSLSSAGAFWYGEWKKRVWILLYIWDRYVHGLSSLAYAKYRSNMSIILGRPRLINAMDCDVEPPLDVDIPENLESVSLSAVKEQAFQNDKRPTSVSINLFAYWLSRKVDEVRMAGADKRGVRDYTIVQRFHYEILCLLENLPPALRPQRPDHSLDLQMPFLPLQRDRIYGNVQCLILSLHRPHVAQYLESRERAREAALDVLDSQQRLFELINRNHYAYFGIAFFSINAAIVLSTMVTVYPCDDIALLRRIVFAIQLAISRLCLIEPQNELAQSGIKIVRSCYEIAKEKYDEMIRAGTTGTSSWPLETESRIGMGNARNDHYQTLDFDMDFGSLNSSQAMDEVGIGYWMGYRQQVLADATSLFDGDSLGFSGPDT